jgi:hypothetical protein
MNRLATLLVAAGALALMLVTLTPDPASAGWRRGYGGWGGPRVGIYVGPGWGYGYRYYNPYRYYSYGYYPYAYYPYWRGHHAWRRYGWY